MKNMKKLLQKAMVFTLSAAMLVGTPMTASAAGLVDLYSVSDGTNDDIGNPKDNDDSHTGTVTNTNTDSHSGVLKDNDASIIGIVLDKDYVNAEKGVEETLKATIVYDGFLKDGDKDQSDVLKEIESNIKWEVQYADGKKAQNDVAANKVLSISASAADRTKVTLNPRQGTKTNEEMIVKATIDGSYWWEKVGDEIQKHELKDGKTYTAEAKVFIKEYTTTLKFDNPMPTAYLKHTLDLNDHITRTPETANDKITWISTNTKVATVTAAGVVTFKKVNSKDGTLTNAKDACQIIAVGERGGNAKDEWNVLVEAGEQSSKIEIVDSEGAPFPKKQKNGVDLRDGGWTEAVDVVMYKSMKVAVGADGKTAATTVAEADAGKKTNGKYNVKNVAIVNDNPYVVVEKVEGVEVASEKMLHITDTVAWTSNKPAIVSVKADKDGTGATLTANGVGKAAITAKASSGKSDKLTVTVKATLKGLEIAVGVDDDEHISTAESSYSGKSLQLYARKDPAESKDAVKWSIAKVEKIGKDGQVEKDKNDKPKMIANPNAKINNKGVLTIQPKLDPKYPTVTVELKSAKQLETGELDSDKKAIKKIVAATPLEVSIKQSSIDGITVTDDDETIIADVSLIKGKIKVNDASIVSKANNTTKISVPKNRTYTATVVEGTDGYEAGLDTLTWTTSNAKVASIESNGGTAKITAKASGTATITVSGIRAVNQTKNGVTSLKSASVIKTTFKVSVKQPVKTVTLNKPSVVLNEKLKNGEQQNQKVALKATLGPKGVNAKSEKIHWTVEKNGEKLTATKELGLLNKNSVEITSASVSVNLPTPKVGDKFEITATAESGASATSVVKIVKKTTGVEIWEAGTNKPFEKENPKNPNKPTKNTAVMKIAESITMEPQINISTVKNEPDWKKAGTDNRESIVSYTVNKKGIVTINEKTGEVYAIKDGKVTITAKTESGKTAKLTVEVSR